MNLKILKKNYQALRNVNNPWVPLQINWYKKLKAVCAEQVKLL